MNSSLIDKFFSGREDLLEQVKVFEKKRKLNLLKSLKSEDNESQFLSKISEIQFGLFLDQNATALIYEKSIDDKTPDWFITMYDQEIIAEVVRLNPSARDKVDLDFIDKFMDSIQEIEIGCFLSFDCNYETIERENIDFSVCKSIIKDWISNSPNIHDKIVLYGSIEVEFMEFNEILGHACLAVNGDSINSDSRRLSSEKSTLALKGVKYSEIIEKYNIPYIICIYIDFHSWFRKLDLYQALYGSSAEHENKPPYFSHIIEKALYYSPNQIMKNVSGIILRQGNEYTYFHNYSNNRLSENNLAYFSKWQHPYE